MVKNNTMDMDEGFSEGLLPFFKAFWKYTPPEERYTERYIRNEAFAKFNDESLVNTAKGESPRNALFAVRELAFYRTDPKALEEVANSRQDYIGKFARYMLALREAMVAEDNRLHPWIWTTRDILEETMTKDLLEMVGHSTPLFELFSMYKLYPLIGGLIPRADLDVVKKAVNIAINLGDIRTLSEIFINEIRYRNTGLIIPRKEVLEWVVDAFNELWRGLSDEISKHELLKVLPLMMESVAAIKLPYGDFSPDPAEFVSVLENILENIKGVLKNMLKEGYISPMDFANAIAEFLKSVLRNPSFMCTHLLKIDPFLRDLIDLEIRPIEKAKILTSIAEESAQQSNKKLFKIVDAILRLPIDDGLKKNFIGWIERSTGIEVFRVLRERSQGVRDIKRIISEHREERGGPVFKPVKGGSFGNLGNPTRRPKK